MPPAEAPAKDPHAGGSGSDDDKGDDDDGGGSGGASDEGGDDCDDGGSGDAGGDEVAAKSRGKFMRTPCVDITTPSSWPRAAVIAEADWRRDVAVARPCHAMAAPRRVGGARLRSRTTASGDRSQES